MTISDRSMRTDDGVQDLLAGTNETTAPQWGEDAPRGARAVLSRIIKDGANVPLFLGQTLINSLRDVGYNHATAACTTSKASRSAGRRGWPNVITRISHSSLTVERQRTHGHSGRRVAICLRRPSRMQAGKAVHQAATPQRVVLQYQAPDNAARISTFPEAIPST